MTLFNLRSPGTSVLTGINHLTIAVSDLARSVDFYTGLLNFRLVASWNDGAYLAVGELWVCLALDRGEARAHQAGYTHYAFSIGQADIVRFRHRLQTAGVTEWKANRSEGDSFYFLDPDGHQLEAHVGSLDSRLASCREQPYAGMRFFEPMDLRQATFDDIPAMSAIRLAVKENVLSDPSRVTMQMYRDYLELMGRGWVVEIDGEVVGFCYADKNDASIWALFVSPPYEGRGIAKRLLRAAVEWLFSLGHASVHLSTSKDTRADKFYTGQGWTRSVLNDRDAGFSLTRTPPGYRRPLPME
jgi:catechol 2,3-dioxygenase-like lactoylglutathione lyase family enzyme/GNAT superfamily N-acetyltransferase